MVAATVAVLAFLWWLIIVVAWVIFIFITISIARAKGRSGLLWGILACSFR